MAHTVATPAERPAKSAVRGRTDTPKYSRTSVLCNGQIVWKVGSDRDMDINLNDEEKADLRAVKDVKDDLNALNGLQLYRSRPLTPIEIKQPLRHVHMCLPNNVKARTYTGDLYGSIGHVFSCSDEDFNARRQNIFGVAVQDILYHDFFRRLRRTEYLLWDVEAEKGRWVAVIAHLYSGNSSEEESPNVSGRPPTSPAVDRNRIDEWCIVSAERSPAATARVERVRQRLPKVLREGGFSIDRDSEIDPAIWVPMDPTSWASGLFIFAVIKTLLHRITEFYCKQQTHQRSFWDPIPGWLNIDEVRAEMQVRFILQFGLSFATSLL
ncbi:hypothetical protein GGR51DRAFT_218712 [Nemania sp. FL0031]|nr:hypothetical protein GGR51DRAFT_218712 [Nemania sp. FL0031]